MDLSEVYHHIHGIATYKVHQEPLRPRTWHPGFLGECTMYFYAWSNRTPRIPYNWNMTWPRTETKLYKGTRKQKLRMIPNDRRWSPLGERGVPEASLLNSSGFVCWQRFYTFLLSTSLASIIILIFPAVPFLYRSDRGVFRVQSENNKQTLDCFILWYSSVVVVTKPN